MEARTSRFKAVQLLLNIYFTRYPRVTIKALSMRSGVPYATLRRIIHSEVNDIKDETVFKLLERILSKSEQAEFINSHYPALGRMMGPQPVTKLDTEGLSGVITKFLQLNPHNLIINLAMTRSGTTHEDVQRLTGESGVLALDEMLESGIFERHGDAIRTVFSELDLEALQYSISNDVRHSVRELSSTFSLISHTCESIRPDALARIVAMSREFLKEIEKIKEESVGSVPFFFDIVVGAYDRHGLPTSSKMEPFIRHALMESGQRES